MKSMTDVQAESQDTNQGTTITKDAVSQCACIDTAGCCPGCACTKTCGSCGHVSRPGATPFRQDAWSMFAVGALCGLLFGILLLMVVALDGRHDSYEDACHPRHRNSHECQMYMYHESLQQPSRMSGWGMDGNQDMYNHDEKMCDMMSQMGQMSSPPTHSPCVMQGSIMDGSTGSTMGGMMGGMSGDSSLPQGSSNGGWSSRGQGPESAQQDAAARYVQEKANFDKFLMDETVKFESSIKGVEDPAEREMRQKDFQSWLRDRQIEFNASHDSNG